MLKPKLTLSLVQLELVSETKKLLMALELKASSLPMLDEELFLQQLWLHNLCEECLELLWRPSKIQRLQVSSQYACLNQSSLCVNQCCKKH